MILLSYIVGLPLAYLLICWSLRLLKERDMIDLKYKEEYMSYSVLVKEELEQRFTVSWTLFYEAYLFVYSNQNIIPNDKEINEFRKSFSGYFKMKITESELNKYLELFDNNTQKFDEHIDYMFMQKCQKTFITPTLEAFAEASKSSRKNGRM